MVEKIQGGVMFSWIQEQWWRVLVNRWRVLVNTGTVAQCTHEHRFNGRMFFWSQAQKWHVLMSTGAVMNRSHELRQCYEFQFWAQIRHTRKRGTFSDWSYWDRVDDCAANIDLTVIGMMTGNAAMIPAIVTIAVWAIFIGSVSLHMKKKIITTKMHTYVWSKMQVCLVVPGIRNLRPCRQELLIISSSFLRVHQSLVSATISSIQ